MMSRYSGPPLHELTEKLAVPKTAHPSGHVTDVNSRHALVPRSLGDNSLGGRFGPGKKQAFHRNGRPMFSLSDDRVMADRVLKTHSPDMVFFDVKSLLSVVDDIFKSHVPSIDSSAPKPSLVFKDYADHTSFETFADLIDQISCEVYIVILVGDFEMNLKRKIGETTDSIPMNKSVSASPTPSQTKPASEKVSPFMNATYGRSSKLAALEKSRSTNYVLVTSPSVSKFQRSRTVKGKKKPPSCKMQYQEHCCGYLL